MRSRYRTRELERAHFVTSTIVDWLPVFQTAACCDILAQSLDYCRREKGLRLYAWVIMPNHFHAVVHADQLPRVMADLKKFTAGKLLRQLKEENRTWLLELLAVAKAEHKSASAYQIWQERGGGRDKGGRRVGEQAITRRPSIPTRRCSRRSTTSTPTRSGKAGSPRPSTGATAPRTSGWEACP